MPEGYGQDYHDAELLQKYQFELSVGEDWFESLIKWVEITIRGKM